MPEIELHQLDRPYEGLRIVNRLKAGRLLSSMSSEGQQAPVLVTEKDVGGYVLVDGYQRVATLEKLGRDSVKAVVLDLDEASALIFRHRQESSTKRSALEEAWLLRELTEQHGLNQHELAYRLGHNQSWVSRRLGLLAALPGPVQELIRQGRLSSYSATKYLVPMARAIGTGTDCEKLAEALAGQPVSTRQMERLYIAWRSSDVEGRARLVENPLLFLRATVEMARSEPPHPDAHVGQRRGGTRRAQPPGGAAPVAPKAEHRAAR